VIGALVLSLAFAGCESAEQRWYLDRTNTSRHNRKVAALAADPKLATVAQWFADASAGKPVGPKPDYDACPTGAQGSASIKMPGAKADQEQTYLAMAKSANAQKVLFDPKFGRGGAGVTHEGNYTYVFVVVANVC